LAPPAARATAVMEVAVSKVTMNTGVLKGVGGADIAYALAGPPESACTFLCFNGAFLSYEQWRVVAAPLASAGARLLVHDVRGTGLSSAAPKDVEGAEQFTFDRYADDAAALLSALNLLQRVVVWGMAWGARAALVFAARHPERTAALLAYDISVGVAAPIRAAQRMGMLLARDKMKRQGIVEPANEAKDLTNRHLNQKLAEMAMHATSKAPYDSAETFMAATLGAVDCPILVALGEFDPNLVLSPGGAYEVVEKLQTRLPATELHILDATGHGSVNHRPLLCANVALDFVRRHSLLPATRAARL